MTKLYTILIHLEDSSLEDLKEMLELLEEKSSLIHMEDGEPMVEVHSLEKIQQK